MSTIEKVEVQGRSGIGSTASRRLRTEGIVPANLYGHEKGAVPIQLGGDLAHALINNRSRVVDLELNGETEKALLKDVQWDTFSKHILHIDFLRVDPDERVQVDVPVILRGTSPGVLGGGILEHHLHHIQVECLAVEIPDAITVRIGSLNLGDHFHVSDLVDLPAGMTVNTSGDVVIVSVVEEKGAKSTGDADEGEAEAEGDE